MKLLFAEDEVELSRAVCAILRHQGNEVDPAYDGEEALRKARAGSYDCMVMDVMMPRQDGISVVRTLRAEAILRFTELLRYQSDAGPQHFKGRS